MEVVPYGRQPWIPRDRTTMTTKPICLIALATVEGIKQFRQQCPLVLGKLQGARDTRTLRASTNKSAHVIRISDTRPFHDHNILVDRANC